MLVDTDNNVLAEFTWLKAWWYPSGIEHIASQVTCNYWLSFKCRVSWASTLGICLAKFSRQCPHRS